MSLFHFEFVILNSKSYGIIISRKRKKEGFLNVGNGAYNDVPFVFDILFHEIPASVPFGFGNLHH